MDAIKKLKENVDNKNAIIEINYRQNEKAETISQSSIQGHHAEHTEHGDLGDHGDHGDHVDMMMKPKGINIF